MATPALTATQYIAWVQRSLNRLLGCALITDGSDTTEYRDQVRDFFYGPGIRAEIDVPQQDALIKANHLTPDYVSWAQTALTRMGARMGGRPTGTMDAGTRTSVRCFQAYEGLRDDGWIGPRTETVLILRSGILPPGHIAAGVPAKRPPKPPVLPRPVDPLPPEKRLDRVINAIIYEIQFNPQVYPNTQERTRIHCLMQKLKKKRRGESINGRRVDDQYIPLGATDFPRKYALQTGPGTYEGGATVESLALSASQTLQREISRLPPDKRTDQDTIREVVVRLHRDIAGGLGSIANVYGGVHGDSNMGAKLLNQWGMDKQKRSESILSCYA